MTPAKNMNERLMLGSDEDGANDLKWVNGEGGVNVCFWVSRANSPSD